MSVVSVLNSFIKHITSCQEGPQLQPPSALCPQGKHSNCLDGWKQCSVLHFLIVSPLSSPSASSPLSSPLLFLSLPLYPAHMKKMHAVQQSKESEERQEGFFFSSELWPINNKNIAFKLDTGTGCNVIHTNGFQVTCNSKKTHNIYLPSNHIFWPQEVTIATHTAPPLSTQSLCTVRRAPSAKMNA